MDWLFDGIGDWLKQLFIDAIMASFAEMFSDVNAQVGNIATQVGTTPEGWNSGVFSMIRTLSETVVLPIAGMILTFVLCYELIQLIIEKNNLQDFDTFNIYKWIFKTFVAVFILTNTFNIVMGVFDIGQHVVNQSAGLISGDLTLGNGDMMDAIRTNLEAMEIGELIGLFFETQIVKLCMGIMSIFVMVIVWGRMIEIYLTVSIAPIPLSTMVNREWGQMGNNYLKSLFALAFQGFLIMVCVAIYAVLVAGISASDNMHIAIWGVAGNTALLCFILLKTGGIAKSILNAH
ncbi:VirB6/TrbL-like conjugal transfer protein, CD1112 family [Alkalibaculum bacchi]|uniref:VirB6/TrbL-like conjugal transfer protein, CD1112 family n=1 Tax=Alkalibaculum bacchi TaxID=645887 RepID=UPI0026EF9A45|nr:CD0415/CD1112 family protein [Alkalibaculum bacchi]